MKFLILDHCAGLDNLGTLHGQLSLCLGIACLVIFILIAAGTRSIGKVRFLLIYQFNYCWLGRKISINYGILLPKLFWPTVRKKNVLVIEKNFWNSRLKAENLQIFEITWTIYSNSERSEQFLVTECFFNLFMKEIWKIRTNKITYWDLEICRKS